ncbi:hypothetical protein [Bradyrhizobium sp. CCBAU 051011]|uniref:hypothetical protein n=1 Tax=Bradyrhizobium sp. CCBAU 051011 TaxID=858422 RepID=UPI001FF020AD|nr:hypothetical protein [Bradyrhizobium sp. CCBAU 051011]
MESLIYPAVWTDIIAWLHFGLIEAEELGVTAANVDERPAISGCSDVRRSRIAD